MSIEGLVALGIAAFVFTRMRNALKTAAAAAEKNRPVALGSISSVPANPKGEDFSLERVLREIQRLKQEAEQGKRAALQPKPMRQPVPSPGPEIPVRQGRMAAKTGTAPSARTGRMATAQVSRRLPMSGSDPERGPLGRISRTSLPSAEGSLEGESLEVAGQDEQGEALVQRRIYAAEHRTREGREASYQAQEQKVLKVEADRVVSAKASTDRVRRAIVWREVLGAPVGLRGNWHLQD